MRVRHVPLLAVLLASSVLAATPPDDDILLPVAPVVPSVMPGAVTALRDGERFVAQSKYPCDVECVPDGVVSWEEKKGPRDWTAIFSGGTGGYEDRTFTYPYLYAFKGVKTDKVVVFLLPREGKAARKRFTLDVDAGTKPQPPPDVDPIIPPKPVKSFRVIWVYESADTLTQAQKNVIFGKTAEDYLSQNCTGGKAGWRRRDKDSGGELDPTFAALWAAVKAKLTTLPCVAIEADAKVDILPVPATPVEAIKTFDAYRGVK